MSIRAATEVMVRPCASGTKEHIRARESLRGEGHRLVVGGFVPFSTADYPDHLCAVVFCQGCPWRCSYCHNPHLQPAQPLDAVSWADVLAFLDRRRGLLDAVVFSGGEPTVQPGLLAAMHGVKELGFKVGLHTAGIYPRHLAKALPLLDWIGFDVKAPFSTYERVTRVPGSDRAARESAELVIASRVAHEFRTTFDRSILNEDDLAEIRGQLVELGAQSYVVQPCRPAQRTG